MAERLKYNKDSVPKNWDGKDWYTYKWVITSKPVNGSCGGGTNSVLQLRIGTVLSRAWRSLMRVNGAKRHGARAIDAIVSGKIDRDQLSARSIST
ncbi:hypothetical protein PInf_013674 [Phytophthora infestans]|nr:hypothetical protein PInf_013674 [Phytophthora infestans]